MQKQIPGSNLTLIFGPILDLLCSKNTIFWCFRYSHDRVPSWKFFLGGRACSPWLYLSFKLPPSFLPQAVREHHKSPLILSIFHNGPPGYAIRPNNGGSKSLRNLKIPPFIYVVWPLMLPWHHGNTLFEYLISGRSDFLKTHLLLIIWKCWVSYRRSRQDQYFSK